MPMWATGTSSSVPVRGVRGRAAGFTLLELLVVVFIIGIMATMFTLAVGVAGGTDRELRREAERLQSLIGLAMEDAEFKSRELGLRLYPGRYEFSVRELVDDPAQGQEALLVDPDQPGELAAATERLDRSRPGEDDDTRSSLKDRYKWVPQEDEIFGRHEVPAVFELELEIEGKSINLERSEKDVEKKYEPQLFIFSSGDISDAFDVHIRSRDEDRSYTLEVAVDGTTKLVKGDG